MSGTPDTTDVSETEVRESLIPPQPYCRKFPTGRECTNDDYVEFFQEIDGWEADGWDMFETAEGHLYAYNKRKWSVPSLSPTSEKKSFKPPPNWAQAKEFVPKSSSSSGLGSFVNPYTRSLSSSTEASGTDSDIETSTSTGSKISTNAKEFIRASVLIRNQQCTSASSMLDFSSSSSQTPSTNDNLEFPLLEPTDALQINTDEEEPELDSTEELLCPFATNGECRFGDTCVYVHGEYCEYCQRYLLHPGNQRQRLSHLRDCIALHEENMAFSFRLADSIDKRCGICLEVIMEKATYGEQRFGILPSCCHCFCLSCIRTWRQNRQFENRVIRSCPECRIPSDFVCPSRYWMNTKEDKTKLIEDYKQALKVKSCRYYNGGSGFCPFGLRCFYRHGSSTSTSGENENLNSDVVQQSSDSNGIDRIEDPQQPEVSDDESIWADF